MGAVLSQYLEHGLIKELGIPKINIMMRQYFLHKNKLALIINTETTLIHHIIYKNIVKSVYVSNAHFDNTRVLIYMYLWVLEKYIFWMNKILITPRCYIFEKIKTQERIIDELV